MLRFQSMAPPLAVSIGMAAIFLRPASAAETIPDDSNTMLAPITVIAQHLNDARNGIQTQTGASTYVIDEAAISAAPGGDNNLLNQVVMQAPDVVQDSFGQFHVRGEHNGRQEPVCLSELCLSKRQG